MKSVYEIFCKEVKIVVVSKTIFDKIYPFHIRKSHCPHCREFLQYEFYGTAEELNKEIVKVLPKQ